MKNRVEDIKAAEGYIDNHPSRASVIWHLRRGIEHNEVFLTVLREAFNLSRACGIAIIKRCVKRASKIQKQRRAL